MSVFVKTFGKRTVSLSWRWNATIDRATFPVEGVTLNKQFVYGGTNSCTKIRFTKRTNDVLVEYMMSGTWRTAYSNGVWTSDEYRNITFSTVPQGTLLEILDINATAV